MKHAHTGYRRWQRLAGVLTYLLVSTTGCLAEESVAPNAALRDEGTYTIPIPAGWVVIGKGGHSFYQSGGGSSCFSFIDAKTSDDLAELCASYLPWDDVQARAKQWFGFYAMPAIKRETRTTPGGATYHAFVEDDLAVRAILLEGKDNLLRIDVNARWPRTKEVADTLIAELDRVVWRTVQAGALRKKVADFPSWSLEDKPTPAGILCEAVCSADVELTTNLLAGQELDIDAICPSRKGRLALWLADYHQEAWQRVQALVPQDRRRELLNIRLIRVLAWSARSRELLPVGLTRLEKLVAEEALPVDSDHRVAWEELGRLLIVTEKSSADHVEKSAQLTLAMLKKLPERKGKAMRVGNDFSDALFQNKEDIFPLPDKNRLEILRLLQEKYGQVVFWDHTPALRKILKSASAPVADLVGRLEPVAPGDADTITLAIQAGRLDWLHVDLRQQILAMTPDGYRKVLEAAQAKSLETGDDLLVKRMLRIRKL